MLCYYQIIAKIKKTCCWCSFLIQNTTLRTIDRQRACFKWGGMKPKDERAYSAINNHSPIILDAILLTNNSENTFRWCFPLQKHKFT